MQEKTGMFVMINFLGVGAEHSSGRQRNLATPSLLFITLNFAFHLKFSQNLSKQNKTKTNILFLLSQGPYSKLLKLEELSGNSAYAKRIGRLSVREKAIGQMFQRQSAIALE